MISCSQMKRIMNKIKEKSCLTEIDMRIYHRIAEIFFYHSHALPQVMEDELNIYAAVYGAWEGVKIWKLQIVGQSLVASFAEAKKTLFKWDMSAFYDYSDVADDYGHDVRPRLDKYFPLQDGGLNEIQKDVMAEYRGFGRGLRIFGGLAAHIYDIYGVYEFVFHRHPFAVSRTEKELMLRYTELGSSEPKSRIVPIKDLKPRKENC